MDEIKRFLTMSDGKFDTPSEMIVLDGKTYKRDNLDSPYSGTYNWVAEDGSDIESFYEKGKCTSRTVSKNGVIKSNTYFKNDEIEEIRIFDENGRVRMRSYIANGKLHGVTEMLTDGNLILSTEFKDGKKHGWTVTYSVDGYITSREYFIDDVKQTE
ncbi:toxin-antitoxin system YwqK family antitoxin [Sphingobacterium thalpophilum]|uniref:toxin-antitoxin system YwqK family antitoxin n=1 Tax=Sphingobacterium thalpophilum TaxID=259 RepID=UPI0024A60E52|nr:hypothetical protein [Sphingobacterium thalpophilum]